MASSSTWGARVADWEDVLRIALALPETSEKLSRELHLEALGNDA